MPNSHSTQDSPTGAGLTSVVLGSVGLVLSLLPVLGIPLSIAGLAFGLVGLVLALRTGWMAVRWSIGGIALSGLALGVSLTIAWIPVSYLPGSSVPLDTRSVPDRPYVAPPARPGELSDADREQPESRLTRRSPGS